MELICPECRTPLSREMADTTGVAPWRCDACGKDYPVRDGVICFLDDTDPFYEGRFAGQNHIFPPKSLAGRILLRLRLRWALDMQYPGLLRRTLRSRHVKILDLGCGGGNTELLRHGATVTGVDLSRGSLKNAAVIYATAIQASAARLPFPDASFDAVVSSNFLGHVPIDAKDAVIAEAARVLRPGGIMLHELETDSAGALFCWARRDAAYFRERLVELDGHIGIEMPTSALERFRRHGLRVRRAQTQFVWWFLPQGEATKRFDNPAGQSHPIVRMLLRVDRWTRGHPRRRKVMDLLAGIGNNALRCITPLDRGIGLCVLLEKPSASRAE